MKTIKKILIVTIGCISMSIQAALPPSARNDLDLNYMVDFAKKHDEVMWTLSKIDLDKMQIIYHKMDGNQQDKDCVIQFTREDVDFSGGYVGPAGNLMFECASCPLQIETDAQATHSSDKSDKDK